MGAFFAIIMDEIIIYIDLFWSESEKILEMA